jgi:hypothetical protein
MGLGNGVSANGYPVLTSTRTGPHPRLRDFVIPTFSRRLPARDGSAGFLLVHIGYWFHREIESLAEGIDDWGYAVRKISGSQWYSNHSSGTALDLNAQQHPMGVATDKTFSKIQIDKIHARLRMYEGCVMWGGDYRIRPDAMHFEINEPIATVVKKAQGLVKTELGRQICTANPGLLEIIT